jgi:hypothetical protein
MQEDLFLNGSVLHGVVFDHCELPETSWEVSTAVAQA